MLGKISLKQILNLAAILSAFGINIWANIAPINGLNIGEISNRFFREVQIIPANYAFAIWGLIYLGLISFGIYQVLPAQRNNISVQRMGYFLVGASLAQIVWVFLYLNRLFAFSFVAMLVILLCLIGAYLKREVRSKKDKWLIKFPISIYLAWISVATIVNAAITLYSWGWNGWGISPQIWTVIMLFVGAAIAATVNIQRADLAYPLVIVWAFIAIAVRQADVLLIFATAGGLAIALILLLFWTELHSRRKV